jgi:hypothetical protein
MPALHKVRFGLVGRQASFVMPPPPIVGESFPGLLQIGISQFALLGSRGEAAAARKHLAPSMLSGGGTAFLQHLPHGGLRRLAPAAGAM